MSDNKKPIPLLPQVQGRLCVVCGKRAYSFGGIHPQCAVKQADAPRQKQLAQAKRDLASAQRAAAAK